MEPSIGIMTMIVSNCIVVSGKRISNCINKLNPFSQLLYVERIRLQNQHANLFISYNWRLYELFQLSATSLHCIFVLTEIYHFLSQLFYLNFFDSFFILLNSS